MYMGGNATSNPLPVTMSYFNGIYHDKAVVLRWATASETNNKGFAVERSEDGLKFEQIGFVNGKGNSQKLNEYTFQDLQSLPIAFYQLRQIDFDGATETSQMIKIERWTENIEVSPNPFNGIVRVGSNDNQTAIEIVIYDLQGKEKLKTSGHGQLVVDAHQLEAGIYLIEIIQGDTKQIKRIIKN
jgi:hypothetical protein